jgi:HD-GYP domain-containing protein (c-di-GMP phosphodiesterase class II)
VTDPRIPTRVDLSQIEIDLSQGDETAEAFQREARDLLTRLFVAVKLAFVYDVNNDTMRPAFEKLAAAANLFRERSEDGVAALQFLADGVYANRTLIKVDANTFEQGQYLYGVWSHLQVSEIAAVTQTRPLDWQSFFAAFQLAVGPNGNRARLRETPFERIRLRAVEARAALTDNILVSERFKALRAYAVCTVALKEAVVKLQREKRPAAAKIKRCVQEMISILTNNEALLLALASLRRHKGEIYHHLANTTVFALVIGKRLALAPRELAELGVQAALHDVGRAFLDDLGDERMIAARSIQKLVHFGASSQAVLGRVVAAHEVRRWVDPAEPDDEPWPPGGAARVIAVAHAYDLLTTPHAERPAMLADEALRLLVADGGRRYDPLAVRLFANALGVFPVGSVVALSTGETAIVIEAARDAAHASRPKVKVVRDPSGALLDGFLVDLAGDAGAERRILHCVDEDEVELNPPAFLLS